MNVNSVYHKQQDTYIGTQSVKKLKLAESKKSDLDSVEISSKAHKEEKMMATSGKDTLGITKGDKVTGFLNNLENRNYSMIML